MDVRPIPCILYEDFEAMLLSAVSQLVKFSVDHLGIAEPWTLVCGISGVKGSYITGKTNFPVSGPFYKDELETRLAIDGTFEGIGQGIAAFIDEVCDAAGPIRPKGRGLHTST